MPGVSLKVQICVSNRVNSVTFNNLCTALTRWNVSCSKADLLYPVGCVCVQSFITATIWKLHWLGRLFNLSVNYVRLPLKSELTPFGLCALNLQLLRKDPLDLKEFQNYFIMIVSTIWHDYLSVCTSGLSMLKSNFVMPIIQLFALPLLLDVISLSTNIN